VRAQMICTARFVDVPICIAKSLRYCIRVLPHMGGFPRSSGALACMFHEDGCVSHAFANRINVIRRLLGIVALGQFVPIHFSGEICRPEGKWHEVDARFSHFRIERRCRCSASDVSCLLRYIRVCFENGRQNRVPAQQHRNTYPQIGRAHEANTSWAPSLPLLMAATFLPLRG
jgi:hypothetical protein